jgi:hypothetical protein
VHPANKYQPYQGYGRAWPWYGHGSADYGRRVRTRSDWHYDVHPWRTPTGEVWEGVHSEGRRWPFWYRPKNSSGTIYQKRLVHRAFRRLAKQAIRRELGGEEVSHTIRSCGVLGTLY